MTEAAPSHLLCHAVYSVGCTIHLLLRLWRKASINEVPEYHGHANRNITRMHDTDPSTTCGASWTWSIVNKLMRSRFNFFYFDSFYIIFRCPLEHFQKVMIHSLLIMTTDDSTAFILRSNWFLYVCASVCVCVSCARYLMLGWWRAAEHNWSAHHCSEAQNTAMMVSHGQKWSTWYLRYQDWIVVRAFGSD